MSKAAIEDIYPLSPMQQGMLFHALLAPEADVYVRQISYETRAELDAETFREAWQGVVDRHPVLRTSFVAQGKGEPHQVVLRRLKLPFEELDWRQLGPSEQRRRLERLHAEDRARGFRLNRAPLLRLTLVRLGERRFRCLWTYHHLILDGWSMTLVLEEVMALYESRRSGRAASLPPARRYGEFIAWLGRRDRGREEAFWREQLAGLRGATPLGIDRPSSGAAGERFVELASQVSEATAERLDAGLRARGLTWSSLTYGLWGLLLCRYGATDDVVMGTVFSGRPAELEGADKIVGLMINTLPLRLRLDPALSLGTWLGDVQKRRARLHEFEHSQLAEVQRQSELPGGVPLIESLVIFENFPRAGGGDGGAPKITDVRTVEATNYPLTLLVEIAGGVRLHLAYDTDRFDSDAIDRLLGHLRRLYTAATDLDQSAGDVALLSLAERQQLLVEWNDAPPARSRREFEPVHRLFERRAAETPNAAAVDDGERRLTYRELAECVTRFAEELRRQGVGRERLVAICGRSSPELLVGLLAVLKAGGAYLPLDPSYPQRRLAFMLEDSGARWLLAEPKLLPALGEHSAQVVPLAGIAEPTAPGETVTIGDSEPTSLEALAYVIYTSGSTGRPKGVAIPHGALSNFLLSMARSPGLTAEDRLLAVTPLSFDIAGLELYLPLIVGARLLLTSRETTRDGDRLAAEITERQVTALQATPATWSLLAESDRPSTGRPLLAMSGGEALAAPLARAMLERWGTVWNLYGPTETTIWSAIHRIGSRDLEADDAGWAALGRPIADTRLLCVDRQLLPVPAAVPGELVIGGAGLARGYRGRAKLTADRFVPESASEPGARLYRTGDLVRRRRDGIAEYLGRLDHQIKLRGHRVELGEIEAALGGLPGVREAVVVGRQDRPGDLRLVAYYAADPAAEVTEEDLREALRERLPEIMVPAVLMPLAALPRTPNGKVDRRALPEPGRGGARAGREPRSDLERAIAEVWAEVLGLERVGVEESFFDLGGHSLLLMRVRRRLAEVLEREVELLELFRHPNVSSLARHLAEGDRAQEDPDAGRTEGAVEIGRGRAETRRSAREGQDAVAIIGMAGRFPAARNLEQFWVNLRAGREGIRFFDDDELRAAGIPEEALSAASYVKAKGLLEDAEFFDAEYFGYPPRDAEMIDPQQRVFLEIAVEAFENSGYDPAREAGAVGVFAGTSMNTYWPRLDVSSSAGLYQAMISNDKDFLATRVSYKLNLKGPSVGVQTACSTSLVAVHMAIQSLLSGECDMALTGGVSITWPRVTGYFYSDGMIVSPDGHCRAFDEQAQGTLSGEGAGAIVLKRLDDALADGDPIRAVLRGSAINNDGGIKVSYTAPSIEGQAAVISEALAVAGVEPSTISYLEAHGTGTPLGDPIEVAALRQAFGERSDAEPCALGSVKTNIGHLDAAAGIAGLIKTVLALEHGELPPSLHYRRPSPRIDFAASGFRVQAELSAWPRGSQPRRAGVSSFGIGGTNAHVVVEEAPSLIERRAGERREELLLLSARSAPALERLSNRLATHLGSHPELDLADVAFTLERGRPHLRHRRIVVSNDLEDAAESLGSAADRRPDGKVWDGHKVWDGGDRPVALLFPGQGAQRVGMARGLYRSEPIFRAEVDQCAELLASDLGEDLRRLIYPEPDGDTAAAAARLQRTRFAQPALFVVEYALARLLEACGVHPEAMIGHSIGEYVAACLAGVFELTEALALVAARGRLMESLPPGSMLAVSAPAAELEATLGEELSLAAINAPARTVVSGPTSAIETLDAELRGQGLATCKIRTSHAFHSAMMEPILAPFRDRVARAKPSPPKRPFLSNLTGDWIHDLQAIDPDYWVEHLRRPVRFGEGVRRLIDDGTRLLVEVGPGRSLAGLVHQQGAADDGARRDVISMLPSGGLDQSLAEPLGRLWLAGARIERSWSTTRPPRRVPLPTYPFERQRLVAEPPPSPQEAPSLLEAPSPAASPLAPELPTASEPAMLGRAPHPPAAPESLPVAAPAPSRVAGRLFDTVERLAGFRRDQIDLETTFQEVGIDSLLLVQFSEAIGREFGAEIPVVRLMEDLSTLDSLIAHLESELGVSEGPATAVATPAIVTPAVATPSTESLGTPPISAADSPPLPQSQSAAFGPYQPIDLGECKISGHRQEQALAELIRRYSESTRESKRRTDTRRFIFADNRASVDFRRQWKEIVYPIIGERSSGSRLWDVDGNEYVDLAMGFGVHLFGHSPAFVTAALHQQIDHSLQLGSQSDLAGEVAEGISRLTGVERVAFSNTGTEAVMSAVRLARTVTGRDKIVLFDGSYHGSFDGVLMRSQISGATQALPIAPGVPRHMARDVVALPYGEQASLATLRELAGELAAVLVEPVQSRRPDLQPREFLQHLREVTRASGSALIFDEVITGLRVHPGGAQAVFGVEADLATYGKVLGGGMPIGVVAGRARFMDPIDGGSWRFGDDSYPRANKTFFAGTFCKHPLAMAAARAVIHHLETQGPELQERLNQRTAELVSRLNGFFADEAVPMRAVHFGSLWRLEVDPRLELGSLFFYYLLLHGVYTWEGRTCFLSTAHTDADLETVVAAVAASVDEMRAAGFFPAAPSIAVEPSLPSEERLELPATHAQQQLWFLARIDDNASRGYNESQTLSLTGRLDASALEAAFERVFERHDALSATFSEDGQRMVIDRSRPIVLPCVDLTALGLGQRRRLARRLILEDARRLFDLENGPLVRATLIELGPRRYQLMITCHHAVLDGQSLGLFLRELEELYRAATAGNAPRLTPSRSLASLIEREVATQDDPTALDYWLGQMRPSPPVLELPVDRPRPAVMTYRGGFRRRQFAAGAELRTVAAHYGTTVFGVVFGAYCLLLHRLTGQSEVLVGVPSAAVEGGDPVLGYALLLLPIRSDAAPGTRFPELLGKLRQSLLEGQQHRNYSYTELLKRLELRPNTSRSPLVATVFNLEPGRRQDRFGELAMEVDSNPTGGARFEIFLNLTDFGDELQAAAEFNADLFDDSTLDRWLRHYQRILAGIAADPGRSLAELTLLDAAERWQILAEWNDTAEHVTAERGATGRRMHELFEPWVDRTPDAVAVLYDGAALTYGELDRRAAQLARHLRELGCGRGDFVGIDVPRSFATVVAVLGVLRAGAAYVPLSPSFPAARRSWILESLGVRVLLTGAGRLVESLELIPETPGLERVVSLDPGALERAEDPSVVSPWERIAQLPTTSSRIVGDAGDLAYVIFTSGSTGTPKGVMVRHRPAIQLIEWVNRRFAVGPADRLLFVTSLTFDLSVYDIFGILAAGGSIRVASEGEIEEPESLVRALREEPITFWDSAPAALQQLAPIFRQPAPEPPAARQPPALRLVFLSGDWIPVALPDAVREAFPRARVISLGGATEATVWSNFHPIDRVEPEWTSIPYGRPITNARYHVLDAGFEPCPIGVAGDLYIGGSCLASGYSGEPALTAAKFLPDPFASGRLYRTGDRARYWTDGELEFLGRLDHQVKIRGFRIELGEIESTLAQHPEVGEAAVLAREDRPGQRRLVAYVTARRDPAPAERDLLEFVALHVPVYMVPAQIVLLDELPVTVNGKLDRAALPAPDLAADDAAVNAGDFIAPRTHEERVLAEIWTELLGLERVGVHQRFLEIGGDSVLSLQVVARAARAGLKISHRQIYEQQTIAALAQVTERAGVRRAPEEPETGELALAPISRWFFDLDLAAAHHFNQSLLFELRRPLDPACLTAAVAHLIEHHGALRQRFERLDGDWRAEIVAEPGPDPVMVVDLSGLFRGDGETAGVAVEDAVEQAGDWLQAGLDLARGPLLRIALLRLGGPFGGSGNSGDGDGDVGGDAGGDRLLLTIHHLAVDGVSWQILLEDLQTAYSQLEAGQPPILPPRTTPLRRWVRELLRFADSEQLRTEVGFWQTLTQDVEELPRELDDGPDDVASVRVAEAVLEPAITRALLTEAPAVYRAEVGDLLLTALARALGGWTGERVVHVELEGHGREEWLAEDLDLSRTVGWFTVLYPVRLELTESADPGLEICSIKEQLRSIPSRGLGYGLLRWVASELSGGGPDDPGPGVLFNYLGQLDRALAADSPFAPADESTGAVRSRRQRRTHPFEVNCFVLGGRLRIQWSYSRHRYRPEAIEALALAFAERLRALVAHCGETEAGGFTASDFPLAAIDADAASGLGRVLADADGLPLGPAVRNVEDVYPLSRLQESLLVNAFADRRSQVGVEQLTLTLRGELDADLFERAWQRVLDRHPVLRTAFFAENLERPLQVVRRRVELPLEVEDHSSLEPALRAERLEAWLAADRRRGFRFDRAPLMRLALLRADADRWHLVWSHHHLILDGWCRALVLEEVLATYSAFAQDAEPPGAPARPFRDYIAWLEGRDRRAEESFWRTELEGFDEPTPLIVDRLPDVERGAPGHRVMVSRPMAVEGFRRLRDFVSDLGVTLATMTQAAWGLLLGRYSGRDDVVFGATVTGRPAEIEGVESMVGMFINNLPVRLRVPPAAPLAGWLRDRQDHQQELRQHEQTALETIQGLSGVPWGRRLFETLVVFQNDPVTRASESAGELEPEDDDVDLDLHSYTLETAYPLTLVTEPQAGGLSLDLYFETSRLDRATADRWLGHFQALLESMVAAPRSARLTELSILTAAERRQIASRGATDAAEVLDACGWPAPVGIFGELATAEAGRTRRLGRWARRLPDGELERLGPIEAETVAEIVPGEIEALLSRHPAVLEAVVATVERGPNSAPRPVAWVVSRSEPPPSSEELRFWLRNVLPERALPTAFVVVDELARDAQGEFDRAALRLPETVATLERLHEPPQSALEYELVRIWEELFDLRPIGIHDDFFELGGHSLLAVRLVGAIRDRFGHQLALETLFEGQTIERLAARLESTGSVEWSPLIEIQPGQNGRTPLFLMHPSGGGALGYVDLARHLGAERPVYGLQARGHAPGQEPLESVEDMAALYVAAIREKFPAGPYFLGGSSFGGYLAYEMAQQLHADGAEVPLVLMLDTSTWSGEAPDPVGYLSVLVDEMLGETIGALPVDRDLDGQLSYVLEELLRRELVPEGFALADLRHYFDLYWINILAAYAYHPQAYPGQVVVFRALDNPEEHVATEMRDDPTLGWGSLAEAVEVHEVPGTHFNLIQSPQVGPLAEALEERLASLENERYVNSDPMSSPSSAGRDKVINSDLVQEPVAEDSAAQDPIVEDAAARGGERSAPTITRSLR